MKIIVAGGTGFLGKKIVSSLADKGHNVCVLTRNTVSYTHLRAHET